MPVPQEIVDAVIDCFGVPLDQPQSHNPIFYRWDLDKSALNSWALVSKACNHRVRYYLFSHCKIIAAPSFLQVFAQCPDVLLKYTRFLYVYRPRNLGNIQSIIYRFSSSPLIRVKFVSAQIPAGFPTMFGSILPNAGCVQFEMCLFDPIAIVKLRSYPDLQEVAIGGCVVRGILGSVGDIKAGIPRRLPDRRGDPKEVTGHVLRSLRVLRLESTTDGLENELVKACAGSLEFIEIETKEDWASSSFCPDIGTCSKLRGITLDAPFIETSTINNLIILLSSLRNPPLTLFRIRVFASNLSADTFEPHSPTQLDAWRRLDELLRGLCQQMRQEYGGGLTFQIASRKTNNSPVGSSRLLGLLPSFSRVGTCQEVEV